MQSDDVCGIVRRTPRGRTGRARCARRDGAERRPDRVPAVRADRRRHGRRVRRCVLRGASRTPTQTACVACGVGFAGTGGECAQCAPGSEPNTERTACAACAVGSAGSDGTCAVCPDATEPNADQTACQPCAPTDAGTAGVCTMCAAGSEPSRRPDELCGVCDWVCGHWRRVRAVRTRQDARSGSHKLRDLRTLERRAATARASQCLDGEQANSALQPTVCVVCRRLRLALEVCATSVARVCSRTAI